MASGNIVGFIYRESPPATLFAVPNVRAGGSTPAERDPVWEFDASTQWYMDFYCMLRGYDGGGLTVLLPWSAASATSGQTRWGAALRRRQDDAEDIDGSQTYDYNEVSDTCASASGELSYPTITFTDGADMDNVADGELFVLRVTRVVGHADDGMTGLAQLTMPEIRET